MSLPFRLSERTRESVRQLGRVLGMSPEGQEAYADYVEKVVEQEVMDEVAIQRWDTESPNVPA